MNEEKNLKSKDVKYNLGKFEGGSHFFPARIFYNHTDAGGMVFHVSYLRIAEEARCAMFDTMVDPEGKCPDARTIGGSFVVRKIEIDYFTSARYGDQLIVESRFEKIGHTSLVVVQDMKRGCDLVVTVRIIMVFVNVTTKKPEKIPDFWLEHIQKMNDSK